MTEQEASLRASGFGIIGEFVPIVMTNDLNIC